MPAQPASIAHVDAARRKRFSFIVSLPVLESVFTGVREVFSRASAEWSTQAEGSTTGKFLFRDASRASNPAADVVPVFRDFSKAYVSKRRKASRERAQSDEVTDRFRRGRRVATGARAGGAPGGAVRFSRRYACIPL
jgi:hypothetical protein